MIYTYNFYVYVALYAIYIICDGSWIQLSFMFTMSELPRRRTRSVIYILIRPVFRILIFR